MNKLKGKLESYVVSTTEENHRILLLDNLAMSVKQVEDDAEYCIEKSGTKEIGEKESVAEFCRWLLAILSHGLKVIHIEETPSFWSVAGRMLPKDTVKMIYRLGIRQSDSARCEVWVRHALIEGTVGSYLTLLEEDTKILKQSYKTTAFVRDPEKMKSAKDMINSIASVQFNIKIDYMGNDQVLRRVSTSSADLNFGRLRNKGRESVVTIEDSYSSFYNSNMNTDTNEDCVKHSDTFSLPGDISKRKDKLITDKSHTSRDECSLSNMSPKYMNSPIVKNEKYEKGEDYILKKEISRKANTEISEPSDNSLCSSVDSDMDCCLTMDNVIVNMIRVVSDEGDTKTTEDIYVKKSVAVGFHDSELFNSQDRKHSPVSHIEVIDNQNLNDKLIGIPSETVIVNSSKTYNEESIDDITNYNESSTNGQPTRTCDNLLLTDDSENCFAIISNEEIVSETLTKVENHTELYDKPDNINITNQNVLYNNTNNEDLPSLIDNDIAQNTFNETSLCRDNSKHINEPINNDDFSVNTNLSEPEKMKSLHPEEVFINPSKEIVDNINVCNNQQEAIGISLPCIESVQKHDLNCGNVYDINFQNTAHDPSLINCSSNEKVSDSASSVPPLPTLNIFGSLIHSYTSAFKVVKKTDDVESYNSDAQQTNNIENNIMCNDILKIPRVDGGRFTQNKVSQIINVINEQDNISENLNLTQPIDDLSSSGSIKTEEEYRNQVGMFHQSIPVKGSSQLTNILNDVNVHGSNHDDYFVPGIHNPSDILSSEFAPYKTNSEMELLSTSMPIPSAETTMPPVKNILTTDHGFSPSTLCTLSSRLFEKTLFKARASTLGSSHSSDKAVDDGHVLCSDSESDSSTGQSFSLLADLGITDDFIGMKEDHFSTPETFMGFSSLEELENAIASCKQLINASPEKSKRRDDLVTQLVQLRLKLHELKDTDIVPKIGKKVLGHHFFKQGSISSTLECDACAATIFPLLQKVYVCKDCGFHCHRKCLKVLEKPCVHNKKLNNATCELKICPEIPLSDQQYRCADCFQRIPMCDGQFEARLCDYTGQKYCMKCHWNDMFVIPARVVHNWDFSCYKVSRQSKHLLMVLSKKPDIKLQSINAVLFNFVDELRDVRTLRQQIMMMKTYIISCRIATEERLLLLLQNRQHFVDNSEIYSLQDLIDINDNVLLNELSRIHATFGKHIKFECLLCQGKGFICEFCNADEIIFPFDNHVVGCRCKGTFHRLCYSQSACPKCERNSRKQLNKSK